MKEKFIELVPSQLQVLENEATMLIIPFAKNEDQKIISDKNFHELINAICDNKGSDFIIDKKSPVKKGDKDIFIQEEFHQRTKLDNKMFYKANEFGTKSQKLCEWQPFSKMTKEQSRYTISECIDVRVVKIQDLDISDSEELGINVDNAICWRDYEKIEKGNSNPDYLSMYDECHLEDIRIRIEKSYCQQLKEQNINRTYEDNDYVLLLEITPIKAK